MRLFFVSAITLISGSFAQASWFGAQQKKSEIASTRIYLIKPEHTKINITTGRGSIIIHTSTEPFLKLSVPANLPEEYLAQIKESVTINDDAVNITTPIALQNVAIGYTLYIPAHITKLHIVHANGPITINKFSGSLYAQTIKRGAITINLPKDIQATLHAHTAKSTIDCDMPVTLAAQTTTLSSTSWSRMKRDIHGTLGAGGTPITLETTRGTIRIRGY